MIKFADEVINNPDKLMEQMFSHVAMGGSLPDLALVWETPYHTILNWLNAEPGRKKKLDDALKYRDEFMKESMLHELRAIIGVNLKDFYTDKGELKKPNEWTPEMAKAVEDYNVSISSSDESTNVNIRFKRTDKLKAIALLGKQLKMFSDKVEVSGEVKLEDILARVHRREEK